MIPQDLHYGFPGAVSLLFFILVFLALSWTLFQYRTQKRSSFASQETLIPRLTSIYWLKILGLCVAWLLLVLAFMQPMGNGHYISGLGKPKGEKSELRRKAHEIIFLLDASASMEISDTRTQQSRLDYAKEIIDEMVSQLTGQTVSLYAFTSEVSKVVPPTMDYLFTRIMNRQIQVNEGDIPGTNISAALEYLQETYFSEFNNKQKTLVILSDGGDTRIESLQGTEKEQAINQLLELLGYPKALNLRIFTVGLGSKKGAIVPGVEYEGRPVESKLDEELLQKISQHGRGRYYLGNEHLSSEIATDILTKVGEDEAYVTEGSSMEASAKDSLIYDLYFQVPLGMALLLLAFVFTFPDTFRSKSSS